MNELAQPLFPSIYVVSTQDQCEGRLHSDWISAVQEPDAIHEDIANLLERSAVPGATEWDIQDETGFCGLTVADMSVGDISILGRSIEEHGEPFARWIGANLLMRVASSAESFKSHYCGTFASLDEFSWDYLGRRPGLKLTARMTERIKNQYYIIHSERGLYIYSWYPEDEYGADR